MLKWLHGAIIYDGGGGYFFLAVMFAMASAGVIFWRFRFWRDPSKRRRSLYSKAPVASCTPPLWLRSLKNRAEPNSI